MIHECRAGRQRSRGAKREELIRRTGVEIREDRGRHGGRLQRPHTGDGQTEVPLLGEELLVVRLGGAFFQAEGLGQRLRLRIKCGENVNHVAFLQFMGSDPCLPIILQPGGFSFG